MLEGDGRDRVYRQASRLLLGNPFDATCSQHVTGRVAAKQYQPVSGTTVQEMFSYEKDGRLTKKRLRWKRGSTQQDLEVFRTH